MSTNNNADKRRYVIFAPHVDDEVIGCWSLLNDNLVKQVFYFNEVTPERWDEALSCAARFGFEALRHHDLHNIDTSCTLLLPHIKDNHVDHKTVNLLGKGINMPKEYYSVDMNVPFKVLTQSQQEAKLKDLLELFPSQKTLLQSDQKYYLFESISKSDYETYATYIFEYQRPVGKGLPILFDIKIEDGGDLGHIYRDLESLLQDEVYRVDNETRLDLQEIAELVLTKVILKFRSRNCEVTARCLTTRTVKFTYWS